MDQDGVDQHQAPADEGRHHTIGGRNVVHGDQGRGGQDVFHAAVQMSRMPMCLSDPNRPDNGSVKNLGRYAASWSAWWPKRPSSTAALT